MWKAIPKNTKGLHKPSQARYYDSKKTWTGRDGKQHTGGWVTKRGTDDKGIPYSTPKFTEMVRDVASNLDKIDYNKAVDCQITSIITDYVLGRMSGEAAKKFSKLQKSQGATEMRRHAGLETGPAL